IEPLGLLWSMKPTSEEASPKPEKDIVQWSAHEVSGEPSGVATEIASATTEIFRQVGDLEESALSKDEELQGAFVLRGKGDEKLPVIILLGGSEGGDWSARASAPGLASRGFAAVGVPYYSPAYNDAKPQFDRLPTAFINIPVDRLEAVRDAIEARVDLDADRIGIIGVSKGAEFALLAGSHFDWISAVCAIVPSDVVWEGWGDSHSGPRSCFSLNGKPLPFVPYEGMQTAIDKLRAGEPTTIREPHDAGRIKYAERVPDARIRVEEIRSAVMLVGGDQDETWNSGEMSRNIVETRLEAGLKTEAWISPLAGHYLSGHAFRPLKAAEGSLRSRTYPAMLDFFQRNLRSASND
ncbi:MAG: acyl-CoA thioester hydrolase/BAAT C-terminal domain-containing protein, partial [Planctomycetota bacterium]